MKRILVNFIVSVLSGEAAALQFEAIGAFMSKLFKGGSVVKEAVVVGRTAEAGSVANGLEHLKEMLDERYPDAIKVSFGRLIQCFPSTVFGFSGCFV